MVNRDSEPVNNWDLPTVLLTKDLSFKAPKAKDLTFKAKAKAKDLTSEHVQGPL